MALPTAGLSLCAGIGGLDLALERACPGYRPGCFVELDPRCAAVLAYHWPGVPVWDDLKTFDAAPWGWLDCIAAGFPCQPFSRAARGRNPHPDLWPDVRRVVAELLPPWVFLENVVRHLGAERDLRGLGYSVASTKVAAAHVGAPHKRWRWFCLARHADSYGESGIPVHAEVAELPCRDPRDGGPWRDPAAALRMAHGLPYGMAAAHAFGNAVVPAQAELAFRTLSMRLGGGLR